MEARDQRGRETTAANTEKGLMILFCWRLIAPVNTPADNHQLEGLLAGEVRYGVTLETSSRSACSRVSQVTVRTLPR